MERKKIDIISRKMKESVESLNEINILKNYLFTFFTIEFDTTLFNFTDIYSIQIKSVSF